MLRGVNKSIIEIPETGNEYFEKAILFVRGDNKDKDGVVLKEKAKEYINSINIGSGEKIKIDYKKTASWLKFLMSGAVGAGITALFFIFL